MKLCSFLIGMLLSMPTWAAGNIWLVQVDIDKVSENNLKIATVETTEPTPTTRSFGYKFYLYQTDAGSVSLLPTSGVFYDKRSGADTECSEVDIEDGMTLYLELNQAEFFKGCHLRTIINSSIPYDGDRGSVPSALSGSGNIIMGGVVSINAQLAEDHPVNPFRHLYHPDHTMGRSVERWLEFSEFTPSEGQDNVFSAKVSEEVSGLQRIPKADDSVVTVQQPIRIKAAGEATFIRIHENVELGLGTTS